MTFLEQQFLSCFVTYFSRPCVDSMRHESWIDFLPKHLPKSLNLQHSVRAASMCFYGVLKNDFAVQRDAQRWYIQSLDSHRTCVQNYFKQNKACSNVTVSEEDIIVSMMLLYYELISPTVVGSWIRHFDGVCMLLQLRGPENCRSGASFHIFRAVRLLSVRDHRYSFV